LPTVKSVSYKTLEKVFRLSDGSIFRTHRYSCLSKDNNLRIESESKAYAICFNGEAKVKPIYSATDTIYIGKRQLTIIIKEIETENELNGFLQLEQYHYRGKSLHGKRVPLIATSDDPLLPLVVGYIELSSSFMMNKPRTELLNSTFSDQDYGINWINWKLETVTKWTNLIVRIARTVVSPEYRGLGISSLLVKHAANFAKKHWYIGKLKPFFMEITADMLRYVPFVESAGMHYIGETEGNLHRVKKDMDYLLRNYSRIQNREILREENGGIIDQQVSYVTCLRSIEIDTGIEHDDLMKLLIQKPESLSDDNWSMLHSILRMPKPTYILGLTKYAEDYVSDRVNDLELVNPNANANPIPIKPSISSSIQMDNCSVDIDIKLIRTKFTRKIQQSFGVNKEMLSNKLFDNLNLTINPGEIVLICGPSGVGKTTLLSILRTGSAKSLPKDSTFSGNLNFPNNSVISELSPIRSTRPLINALGNISFEHALFSLNISGLSEAHIYLKKFQELSNGQKYRAMVAKLIASDSNIWVADEFCATLDPITANIVTKNFRRCAKQLGVTAIIVAANWIEFIHELRPDKIIHIRAPWDIKIFDWSEFQNAVNQSSSMTIG
jgi:ABC-type lipoprotein export system ATPase subunit/GNAT superfamily N-acetyltransferase